MVANDGAPTLTQVIDAPPARVFDALADARTYPRWLVGAQRIRRVEDDWPHPGSSFHHTVGAGPLLVRDKTTILTIDPPRELRLRAGVGPLGAAFVRFVVEPDPSGGSRVVFTEAPTGGVVKVAWRTLGRPLMRLGIWGRNAASLERLKQFVEAGGRGSPEGAAGESAH